MGEEGRYITGDARDVNRDTVMPLAVLPGPGPGVELGARTEHISRPSSKRRNATALGAMYRTVNKRRNQHNRLRWIGLTKTGEQLSVTVAQESQDARQDSLNADLGIVPSPVMFGPGLAWPGPEPGL
jgi:hypothetical protein